MGLYTDMNLQRATKLALKLFVQSQEYDQYQANSVFEKNYSKPETPNSNIENCIWNVITSANNAKIILKKLVL